jgi:hypothetical protein
LDGCSTANGNWPGAFGIDKAGYDISHYTNNANNPKHRRPSAFVGWNQEIGGAGWGNSHDFWIFHSEWMFDWEYNGTTLDQAFKNARHSSGWPPGGDAQLLGAMRIYGHTNLHFNEFNQKNDWKWP